MKGLLFSEAMVKAWLAGDKQVTRRLMNPQPEEGRIVREMRNGEFALFDSDPIPIRFIKPRYLPGETVYVKETWRTYQGEDDSDYEHPSVEYKADSPGEYPNLKWKSPRFMPEWATRSHALIVSVRPERVQEITEEEAMREGMITDPVKYGDCCYADAFIRTWESLHPGSWERNDYVWRYELEKNVEITL